MKYLVLITLLIANSALAKNYDITLPEKLKSNLGPYSPQIYIFNQDQSLIYKAKRQDDNLLSRFKLKTALKESETVKKSLEFLMKEPAIFNEKGFTLFILLSSKESGVCPPCDAQMNIINKIEDKLKDRLIVHTLTLIDSAFTIDDLPEGYRPKLIGKQKTKEK